MNLPTTYQLSVSISESVRKNDAYEQPHPPTSSKEDKETFPVGTASHGIPTYEEYVRMATAENWHPSDPVQKLESTIKNFARVSEAWQLRFAFDGV